MRAEESALRKLCHRLAIVRTLLALLAVAAALVPDLGALPGQALAGTAPEVAAAASDHRACLPVGEILGCVEDAEEEPDPDDPPLGVAPGAADRHGRGVARAATGREPCRRLSCAHRATGPPARLIQ